MLITSIAAVKMVYLQDTLVSILLITIHNVTPSKEKSQKLAAFFHHLNIQTENNCPGCLSTSVNDAEQR